MVSFHNTECFFLSLISRLKTQNVHERKEKPGNRLTTSLVLLHVWFQNKCYTFSSQLTHSPPPHIVSTFIIHLPMIKVLLNDYYFLKILILLFSVGTWGPWSSWGSCTVTCGGGTQKRVRACTSGAIGPACPGSEIESLSCNAQSCTSGKYVKINKV